MRRFKLVHITVNEDFYKYLESERIKLEKDLKKNKILMNNKTLGYGTFTDLLIKNKIRVPRINTSFLDNANKQKRRR